MALLTKVAFDARWAALQARYPYQFDKQNIGHSIMPGWLNIAETLFSGVDAILSDVERRRFGWVQLKEKYGGLRAYWEAGPVSVDIMTDEGHVRSKQEHAASRGFVAPTVRAICELVEIAEEASVKTCCFCGEPGERRKGPWILTLCDECSTRRNKFADQP